MSWWRRATCAAASNRLASSSTAAANLSGRQVQRTRRAADPGQGSMCRRTAWTAQNSSEGFCQAACTSLSPVSMTRVVEVLGGLREGRSDPVRRQGGAVRASRQSAHLTQQVLDASAHGGCGVGDL